MFKLEKEHRAGIVSGLIATILFIYFLQPVLDWVSGVVVKILTLTSTAFLDRIYAQAAHLQTQDFAFILLVFVSGFFIITFFIAGLIRLVGGDSLRAAIRYLSSNKQNKQENNAYRIFSGLLLLVSSGFTIAVISANYIQFRTISSFQQHMSFCVERTI